MRAIASMSLMTPPGLAGLDEEGLGVFRKRAEILGPRHDDLAASRTSDR